MHFLDFEKPIAELEAKIEELSFVESSQEIDVNKEIMALKKRSHDLSKSIFSSLTPWQIAQISRHPRRPYTRDYIERIFVDFEELHGERYVADDPAVIAGIGRLGNQSVAVIGHQKGRDTKERIMRNYGMPKPEGYRKALRVMKLAERFNMPVLTFIDTPGAYPGIEAEERGQSEAIARNLLVMSELKSPIIATVIGEGGSGGALAIGVADHLSMLQYSIFSVMARGNADGYSFFRDSTDNLMYWDVRANSKTEFQLAKIPDGAMLYIPAVLGRPGTEVNADDYLSLIHI